MLMRRRTGSTLGKEFAMRMMWKMSVVAVASIAVGMIVVGAGCGSDEKAGQRANKRKGQNVESAKAKEAAKAGRKKIIEAPWLKAPLEGIELSRVQVKKIGKIVAERKKTEAAHEDLREVLDKSTNAENKEMLEQLSGGLGGVEGPDWLKRVRAALNKAQIEKFDANTEG
jgi:hypothetical protein